MMIRINFVTRIQAVYSTTQSDDTSRQVLPLCMKRKGENERVREGIDVCLDEHYCFNTNTFITHAHKSIQRLYIQYPMFSL